VVIVNVLPETVFTVPSLLAAAAAGVAAGAVACADNAEHIPPARGKRRPRLTANLSESEFFRADICILIERLPPDAIFRTGQQ
jgi:hypothetical protein